MKKSHKPVHIVKGGGASLEISQYCDNLPLRFFTYVNQAGKAIVQKEIDNQPGVIAAIFFSDIRWLKNKPKIDWKRPKAAKLRGVEEIYEIRFDQANQCFRPLGFFGPEKGNFTILVWASKKGNVWRPAEALSTAERRRREILGEISHCAPLTDDGAYV